MLISQGYLKNIVSILNWKLMTSKLLFFSTLWRKEKSPENAIGKHSIVWDILLCSYDLTSLKTEI
jgi:hypothetical protein